MNRPATPTSPRATASPSLLEGIIQHDVLNQLTVIRGRLSLALMGLPEGSLRDHIEASAFAADNIVKQIHFIMEHQEAEAMAPAWQDVEALFRFTALSLDLRGIALKIDVRGLEILADPLLSKVFYNLVDNSITHGGKVRAIAVTYQEREGSIDLVCSDDGEGISAEVRKKLFTKGFGKNTGMGLFFSREILMQNGMSISENSGPGEGAHFIISIPDGRYRFPAISSETSSCSRSRPFPDGRKL